MQTFSSLKGGIIEEALMSFNNNNNNKNIF